MRKRAFRGAAVLVVLAGCIYGSAMFVHSLTHESTDNAFVAGTIVTVAPEVRGRVTKVLVDDNQTVSAGQPLFEICRDDYENVLQEKGETVSRLKAEDRELRATVAEREKALLQTQAGLEAARAEEALAAKDMKRYRELLRGEVVSQSQFDRVESQWRVAGAKKLAAQASVDEAAAAVTALKAKLGTQGFKIREAESGRRMSELDLAKTVVKAPYAGRVAMKKVDPGKYVQPGQPLLAVVKPDTWVIANFKETQIKKMAVGQPVKIEVDAYPGVEFKGHVESLQPGTGSVFSLLPPENATGNFVKVVQRVPVKIAVDTPFDAAHPLWPGLSVNPTVDVGRGER